MENSFSWSGHRHLTIMIYMYITFFVIIKPHNRCDTTGLSVTPPTRSTPTINRFNPNFGWLYPTLRKSFWNPFFFFNRHPKSMSHGITDLNWIRPRTSVWSFSDSPRLSVSFPSKKKKSLMWGRKNSQTSTWKKNLFTENLISSNPIT